MFGGDKRNLIIAIGVIFVILVGWQFLMPALFPSDERPRRVAEQREPGTAPPSLDQAAPEMTTGADAPDQAQLRQAGIDSPRITIESRRLSGSIARLGGRIDSVTLLDYHETADEESPNIVLFQPRDAARPFFADFGWITAAGGIALPQPDTLWDADRTTLSPGRPVTLHWDNGAGLSFTRKIAVDDDFVFTVTQSVRNTTAAPIALAPYSRIARFSDATESILPFKPLFIFQDGALGIFGEDYQEADYDDMRDAYDAQMKNPRAGADYRYEATGGWMGLTDKYWLVALIPDQATPLHGSFEYVPVDDGQADSFQTIYEAEPLTVNPRQTVSLTSHLFTGAKVISLLDRYEDVLGVDRLDLAVDFGPAWFLSKPMFYVIDFFNRATGNFGVAILLLTICVRVLLFPLANKAYASMSRMRKLQPEMIRLRERFKDDKQRMNTELMKLYREQKANPVAGCLPLVAQIPVFFALYYMLFVTIEMRHAPFFGWIDDLSAPDPMTFITAFGFLDWPAPEFLLVGIWPLVFGATMWLQMKLNPQPMEPIQQKIMMALPIIFLFLFARFPAGLVVYWTWNNVLSIGQQWLIMRRMGITRQSLAVDAEKIKKIKEAAEKGTLLKPSRSSRKKTTRSGPNKEGARASTEGATRRDGAARARTAQPRASEARRDDAPRRKSGTATGNSKRAETSTRSGRTEPAGGQKTRAKSAPRARTERKSEARSETTGAGTSSVKRATAERARIARRKALARKQRQKAAGRRKQAPTAARQAGAHRRPAHELHGAPQGGSRDPPRRGYSPAHPRACGRERAPEIASPAQGGTRRRSCRRRERRSGRSAPRCGASGRGTATDWRGRRRSHRGKRSGGTGIIPGHVRRRRRMDEPGPAEAPAPENAEARAAALEAGRRLFARPCRFVAGVAGPDGLPAPTLPEIAFAGRSNVGKSSLVNALTGQRALARISNTPGRTRELNFFDLDGRLTLVDLPGYGYAAASRQKIKAWTRLAEAYLRGRSTLRRVCLLLDARRGITSADEPVMAAFDQSAVSFLAVLTKCDKLAPEALTAQTAAIEAALAAHVAAYPSLIATSARTGAGIAALRSHLAALATAERIG